MWQWVLNLRDKAIVTTTRSKTVDKQIKQAIESNHLDELKRLLNLWPSHVDGGKQKPLFLASRMHRPEMIALLLKRGADPSKLSVLPGITWRCFSHHSPKYNWELNASVTPLHALACVGDRGFMGNWGFRPWPDERQARARECCNLLLETERVDMNATDRSGHTALHFTIAGNLFSATDVLLEHGADPMLATNAGETPIDLLQESWDPFPTIEVLVKHGIRREEWLKEEWFEHGGGSEWEKNQTQSKIIRCMNQYDSDAETL